MKTIKTKAGKRITWNVIGEELRLVGKCHRTYFTVQCPKCGYKRTDQKAHIQGLLSCAGCAKKPAALKTDNGGNCIAICEIGTVEFVRNYQDKYGVSERAAVRQFVETIKTHLPTNDPVVDRITENSVRASIRRNTGKVKTSAGKADHFDPEKVVPKKLTNDKPKRYFVTADPEFIRRFRDKHLPGYRLIKGH